MKYVLTMLLLSVCIACSNDGPNVATNISVDMNLQLNDSAGLDLLNPSTSGWIDTSKIRTFHLINGKKVEFLNPRLDAPRGFRIIKPDMVYNRYSIRVFLSTHVDANNCSETYVQWNDTDTDTIRSYYEITPNSFLSKKKWYNGVLKEDWSIGLRSEVYELIK